jgi:hypothetical protein
MFTNLAINNQLQLSKYLYGSAHALKALGPWQVFTTWDEAVLVMLRKTMFLKWGFNGILIGIFLRLYGIQILSIEHGDYIYIL